MSDTSLRILLVEDDSADTCLLREALAAAGTLESDITRVPCLHDALPLLEAQEFDAVLLALSLPDSQGLETLEYARDYARRLPIVVLTDPEEESLGQQAVSAGAQDYLVKGRYSAELVARSLRYAIERHRMQEELRAFSLRDELTGLCNRRGFQALTEQHLKIAERAGADLLVLCIDLEHMKEINETLGHQEGDKALKAVAAVLRKTFRRSDIVARLGGDEFAIAALDIPSGNALIMTSRLRQNLEAYNRSKAQPHPLSLTVGVARMEAGKLVSLEELISQAEAAMLAHKNARKAA